MMRRWFKGGRPRSAAPVVPLRRRLALAGAAVLLLLGGIYTGFLLAFPSEGLRSYLEQECRRRWQLELQIANLTPILPLGIQAGPLKVNYSDFPLTVDELEVAPLWGSLFGRNQGGTFEARLLGGEVNGSLRRQGEAEVHARGLTMSVPVPRTSGLTVSGRLREADFQGAVPARPTTETTLQLVLENCIVTGAKSLGAQNDQLDLGQLTLAAAGRGNALTVKRLSLEGGVLLGSGEGTLLLGVSPAQSRLNLNLSLRPGPRLDPFLAELLPLLAAPAADGTIRFRLTGTLTAPALQK